jgi:hypothetical protein
MSPAETVKPAARSSSCTSAWIRCTCRRLGWLGSRATRERCFTVSPRRASPDGEAAEDRPGGEAAALLGYDLWHRRFGGDPAVVGRVVAIDEEPHRIVGVMPPGFDFPPPVALEGTAPAEKAELWLPLANDLAGGQRGAHHLTVVGRLAAGVTKASAEADLQALAAAVAADHPDTNAGWSVALTPFAEQVLGRSAASSSRKASS